jgi:NAD(P)-dependent dehydrogenase (short-subunit alcohol dehydrogenase family)
LLSYEFEYNGSHEGSPLLTTEPSAPTNLEGGVALVTGAGRGIGQAVARTAAALGRPDVLVNNAGVGERHGREDLDEAPLQRELDVILKDTVLVSQAACPHL